MSDLVNGDTLTLRIDESSKDGPVIAVDLMVKVYLKQVSGASPLYVPITISYRECRVKEFKAPVIVDQTFTYL